MLSNTQTCSRWAILKKRLTYWFDKYNCWPESENDRSALVKKLKREKDDHFETLLREANLNRSFKCRPGVLRCMEEVILGLEGQVAIVSNSNTDIVRKQWEGLVRRRAIITCSTQ